MSAYTKELQQRFPSAAIEQLGSKQMAIVAQPDGTTNLVSYETVVGCKQNGCWYLTTKKYSITTSKQLTQFARTGPNVEWVDI